MLTVIEMRKESNVSQPAVLPTRERILLAAIERFAANGFKGTTTRQIAREAGVNEALIFRHFPDKRALYAAIIERKIADRISLDLIESASSDAGDDRAALEGVARGLIASAERDPAFWRLFYFSALEGHELSRLYLDSFSRRLWQLVGRQIARAEQAGRMRHLSPDLAARAFIGLFAHFLFMRILFGEEQEVDRDKLVKTFVDIFLEGMSLPQPSPH